MDEAIVPGWYTHTSIGRTHYYLANGRTICGKTLWKSGFMMPGRRVGMRCQSCGVRYSEVEYKEREARVVREVATVGDMLQALSTLNRDWPLVIEGAGTFRVGLDRGPLGPRVVITPERGG